MSAVDALSIANSATAGVNIVVNYPSFSLTDVVVFFVFVSQLCLYEFLGGRFGSLSTLSDCVVFVTTLSRSKSTAFKRAWSFYDTCVEK